MTHTIFWNRISRQLLYGISWVRILCFSRCLKRHLFDNLSQTYIYIYIYIRQIYISLRQIYLSQAYLSPRQTYLSLRQRYLCLRQRYAFARLSKNHRILTELIPQKSRLEILFQQIMSSRLIITF